MTTNLRREPSCPRTGRPEIVEFLSGKWERELDYALRKSLWTFAGSRIAVGFQYESHDRDGQWWRSYGKRTVGVRRARPDAAARLDLPLQ